MSEGELDDSVRATIQMVAERIGAEFPVGATIRGTPAVPTAATSPDAPEDAAALIPDWLPEIAIGTPDQVDRELQIFELLGRGAMGEVRVAWQKSLDRTVAVKTVRAGEQGATEAAAVKALLREAELSGGLEHPSVVPVYALARSDEAGPVMVMKRARGVSWKKLIRRASHPFWEANPGDQLLRHLDIFIQVCNAVHFAHSKGIVHRDIKPDNVMVGDFGEVYLLDWGLALRIERETPLSAGLVYGTPAYLAPEMIDPRHSRVTRLTDVFLLGATLHEVLTRQPRHGKGEVKAVLDRAARADPAEYGPEVPEELGRIANRACHRDPAQRFTSALELRQAVEAYLAHRGSKTTTAEAASRLAELRVITRPPPGGEEAPEPDREAVQAEARRAHQLFHEARFGFEQALREWPENAEAARGREACLGTMIEHELALGDYGMAQALIADLGEPRPDLEARLRELGERQRQRAEAVVELEELRSEARFHGQDWRRSVTVLVFGVFWCAVLLGLSALMRAGVLHHTRAGHVGYCLVWLVLTAGTTLLLRNSVADNRAFRSVFTVALFVPCMALLARLVGFQTGASFHQMILADFLIMTTAAGAAAALVYAPLWPSVPFIAGGTMGAAAAPRFAMDLAGTMILIFCVYLAWLVRPRSPANAPGDPTAGRSAGARAA